MFEAVHVRRNLDKLSNTSLDYGIIIVMIR